MDILPRREVPGFHARISLLSDIVISWGPSDHWSSVELVGLVKQALSSFKAFAP
jgi:hypothetical protein